MRKHFKNWITLSLLISFVATPFAMHPRFVNAQATPPSGYVTQGITGYIGNLAPAIMELPLCKAVLANAIKNLFNPNQVVTTSSSAGAIGLGGALNTLANDPKFKKWVKGNLKIKQEEARADLEGVLISDPNNLNEIKLLQGKIDSIQGNINALRENDGCLQSIGKLVIKTLVQKVSLSTVAWIQGGFEGNPAYLANPGEYFTSLARTEILQFGTEIDNLTLFPFGRDYMIRQASYFNRRFQENARYSLNELIQETSPEYTAEDFHGDFSKGGWNAWLAMTTVPANNPLGFELLAAEELGSRISGQVEQTNDALQQADGFLGDQRCVEPKGVTKEMHNKALEANVKIPIIDPETGKVIGQEVADTCKRWEYVTPGKMIAQAATGLVDFGKNSLVEADDLNDAVAAIIDSLVAKWTPELIERGFAGVGTSGIEGYLQIDQDQFGYNFIPTQVESDFTGPAIRGWLSDNPHFNIRKDITQALIDEQRIYAAKLKEQNKVLEDLIKTIHQLDYCIPGPHPGWEQDSRRILSAAENAIVSKTPADMKNINENTLKGLVKASGVAAGQAIGAAIGTGTLGPVLGTIIGAGIGTLVGLIVGWIGTAEEKLLASYYAGIVTGFTGLHVDLTDNNNNPAADIRNKHEVTNGLDVIFADYIKIIRKHFTPSFLPAVADEAAIKFRQAGGYKQLIEENAEQIVALESVILRLGELKGKVDALNAGLGSTPTTTQSATYEAELGLIKTQFTTLVEDMVSGDDISYLDNSLKQARDEVKYVYKDLLIGPNGCEQDLLTPNNLVLPADPAKSHLLWGTKRIEYPFPIWYDYEKSPFNVPSAQLPSPSNPLGTQLGELLEYMDPTLPAPVGNKMPATLMKNGPGFLSTVYFGYSYQDGASCIDTLNQYQLDCIDPTKSFKGIDSWPVTLGKNVPPAYVPEPVNNYQKEVSFEQIIGVY